MTLSQQKIDELRALYDAAPKGRWCVLTRCKGLYIAGDAEGHDVQSDTPAARLLVAVMNALPELLAAPYHPPRGVWLEHTGNECPVAPDLMVRIRMRDGEESLYTSACRWQWGEDFNSTITHYMIQP